MKPLYMEFDPREGMIGWMGDFTEHLSSYKKYISCVSPDYVVAQYTDFAKLVGMEAIKLSPVKEKTIGDVFFKTARSFSYHYNNEEYRVSGCFLNGSLQEFLNFSITASSEDRKGMQASFLH